MYNYIAAGGSQSYTGVPTYTTVAYSGLYPGVDLLVSGGQTNLSYQFQVAAGADYSQIEMQYTGIEGLSIDANGALHVTTTLGDLVHLLP